MKCIQTDQNNTDVRNAFYLRENTTDVAVMQRDNHYLPGTAEETAEPVLSCSASNPGKPHRAEMPYERFLSCGASSLTNAELLAIILRTGTKEKNATQLSREILGFFQQGASDLSALHRLTLEDLMSIPGIGEVKAVKILSLAEYHGDW